jgi:NAD dependent epimerase/dehydratase
MALRDFRGRKVAVTGADGFIGSHLAERLVELGAEVKALVCYNSFDSWGWLDHVQEAVRRSLQVKALDIRDARAVRDALRGSETVFHLAALISIPYSYVALDSYLETNVRGTLNVVQAAQELGMEKVVHTSTSEVYGTARFVPITEEHPLQAQSPYAASKIGADQMALACHKSFGVPVAVVRPFNTYGPRQSTRAVIPTIITQILRGEKRIKLGSLTPTRDFNFVKDTVSGFLAAAASDASLGEVVNIGSNFEISIGDTARLIGEVMGRDVAVEEEPGRVRPKDSEVERLWADNSKAARLLGWTPAYGSRDGLRRGLEETAAWFSDPANLRMYRHAGYTV